MRSPQCRPQCRSVEGGAVLPHSLPAVCRGSPVRHGATWSLHERLARMIAEVQHAAGPPGLGAASNGGSARPRGHSPWFALFVFAFVSQARGFAETMQTDPAPRPRDWREHVWQRTAPGPSARPPRRRRWAPLRPARWHRWCRRSARSRRRSKLGAPQYCAAPTRAGHHPNPRFISLAVQKHTAPESRERAAPL